MSMFGSLNHSGFASLDDLESSRYVEVFAHLEAEADRFERMSPSFRGADYHWPADPLHQWSRVWEYPYVWHHLETVLTAGTPHVMDLGSGVTFFPFALANRGARVTCVDIDPIAGRDLIRAVECLHPGPGKVEFLKSGGIHLDLPDETLDAAYCISVLEHVPDPALMVPEIARVIKPGGLFLLTIDVAAEGCHTEIQPTKYQQLLESLQQYFEYLHLDHSVHPRRLITTDRSPYALRSKNMATDLARRLVNALAKEILHHERGIKLVGHEKVPTCFKADI